ncbi:hypothetical protein NAT51_07930 [Flavobacterium amniphilum]|uniref:hypothetical protein n=1 Tax=Flavobacterium amniphilum TaxID=1834035 RepID=UPI00202A167B|nr:hypothetical protein [Flavobacterium amniphilum]MCL9805446.1 hypothetical protein [Flavobacterium amniphilum]
MRQSFITLSLLFSSLFSFAQAPGEITVKDLELPSAPAFALLDYSPTSITSPTTTQALTLSLLNAVNSSEGFPANYALEFSPYWVFRNKSKNFTDHFDQEQNKKYSKPYKNMSVSFASVKKDTIQNVSVGIRTNLFTINRDEKTARIKALHGQLARFAKTVDAAIAPLTVEPKLGSPEYNVIMMKRMEQMEKLQKFATLRDSIYQSLDEITPIKPLFSIDAAVAYNHFFDGNQFASGKFGKFGAWTTLSENFILTGDNNYLSLYQYARFLKSEMDYNATTGLYEKDEDFDIGTKVEFQFDKLSVGYEYIKRLSESGNYRSVGNIKYILSESFVLNGGFGKNFEHTDNLVSFLGISWGISANNKIKVN